MHTGQMKVSRREAEGNRETGDREGEDRKRGMEREKGERREDNSHYHTHQTDEGHTGTQ